MNNLKKRLLSVILATVLFGTMTVNAFAASHTRASAEDWNVLDQSYLSGAGTYAVTGFYKEAISRKSDSISVELEKSNSSTSSHYMLLNPSAVNGFKLPSKEFTIEVRAKANAEAYNRIGVRSDKYYEIIIDAAGTVKGGGKQYSVDTTKWHDYRFVVGTDNSVFDLYIDGVKALENATTSAGGETMIKIGTDRNQACNVEVESVRAAQGALVPAQGINSITMSSSSVPEGSNVNLGVTARTIGLDGQTATFKLMDSTKATEITSVTSKQAVISEGKAQVSLELPNSLAVGEYYVSVEVGSFNEFSDKFEVLSTSANWIKEYDFSANWAVDGWRNVPGKSLADKDLVKQAAGHTNVTKKEKGADYKSIWLASPASFSFPTGAFTVEARLKVNESTENEGNKFALRFDNNRAIEIYIQSDGFTALSNEETHSSTYFVDTSVWHDYRLIVTENRMCSLYVDGVLVFENIAASTPKTGGGDIIKIGGETEDFCNIDAVSVKVGAGVQYPAMTQAIRDVSISRNSIIAGETITATANGILIPEGQTSVFSICKEDGTTVASFTPVNSTFVSCVSDTQITVPTDLAKGKYYIKIESGLLTQRSSSLTITGASGPKPVVPVFEPTGNTIEMVDYKYNPTSEFNFPSIVDTSVTGVTGTSLGRYYMYYAPHDAPAGICLATADSLDGPWTEYGSNPVVSKNWSPNYNVSHVSSPDVVWNSTANKYFMYFHGENTTTRYATSTDLVTWEYGGVCVVAKDFVSDGNEASYARVFEYEIPGVGNKYIMTLMVNNSKSQRKIYAAHSVDGITWTAIKTPILSPDDSKAPDGIKYMGNLSGAFFMEQNGYQYVITHASSGNMYIFEVGEDLMLEKHWGLFYDSKDADPDHGRAGAPYLIKDDSGIWHMFYEGGRRLNTNIIHAKEVTAIPDVKTITATAGAGGSIAPSGSVEVNKGANKTFTITADTGYHISKVIVNGVEEATVTSTYTFNNVTTDQTIDVEFEADASDVLFFDDFENGASPKWRTESGTWQVEPQNGSNVYKQSNATGGANNYVGESTWDNYSVETTLQTETANAVITISGRATDGNNRYSIGFNKGKLAIARKVGGVDRKLVEKNYTLTPGTPYTLKVEFDNENIRLYVNGVLELETTDNSLSKGFIGIATYNTVAWFDDVLVRAIDGTPSKDELTLIEPSNYQVFQRRLDSQGKPLASLDAEVELGGYYPVNTDKVEIKVVSFDGSTEIIGWTNADINSGKFSKKIDVPQGGWYRVEAKALDVNGNAIKEATGVNKWGVGINILCTGQSNMQGQGKAPYTIADDLVSCFRSGSWRHLKDPYDGAGASLVPSMGNYLVEKLGIPVGFIPAADSGSGLHEPNIGHAAGRYWLNRNAANPADTTTIYGRAIDRANKAGGVELIVWNQGETDGRLSIPKETYKDDMKTLLANFRQDLKLDKIPLFLAQIGNHAENLGATSTDLAYSEIRTAQKELDNAEDFFMAATEMEFDRVDTAHYTTPGLDEIGKRYANAICYYYGLSNYYRGPEIAGAQYADSDHKEIIVDITHRGGTDITPDNGITGFYVYDDGVKVDVTDVKKAGNNSILITLKDAVSGTATVRYLFGFDPPRANVVKDNTDLKLPLEATGDAIVVKKEADKTDFTSIQTLYDNLKDTPKGDYTDASWKDFQDALANAKSVIDNANATQGEVDSAENALQNAHDNLKKKTADKIMLEVLYNALKDIQKDDTTDASWQDFQDALANAKNVIDNANVTQGEVDSAQNDLQTAYDNLEDKQGGKVINKTYLLLAIEEAKNMKLLPSYPGNTTDANIKKFEKALEDAEKAYNNPAATQAEVDTAKTNLQDAISLIALYTADFSNVEKAVKDAKDLIASGKYEENNEMNFYKSLVTSAENLMKNPNATQKEIDEILAKIKDAETKLVKKSSSSIDESSKDESSNSSGESSKGTSSSGTSGSDKSPSTGDGTPIMLMITSMIISILAMLGFWFYRKKATK